MKQTTANNSHLARPSANLPTAPPAREPTRLEILKTKKGRPFAGEETNAPEDFNLCSGIINYAGHLPGLHSPIGTSYPNLVKKSAMFLEDKGKPGWGGPSVPVNDATHDKWGSMKPLPEQLKRDIANLYLKASHPSQPIDPSIGVGYSPSRRTEPPSEVTQKYFSHTIHQSHGKNNNNNSNTAIINGSTRYGEAQSSPVRSPRRAGSLNGSLTPSRMGANSRCSFANDDEDPSASLSRRIGGGAVPPMAGPNAPLVPSQRIPVEQPTHVAGYKGFMAGTRHLYGENFNRIDTRVQATAAVHGPGGKGVTAAVTAASPQRVYGGYESHNLMVANRNAVTH